MSNLTTIPLQDGFRTSLSQSWDGNVGNMFVATTPDFTFPSGATTYAVVQPNGANAKLAEFDSYNPTNGTLNITNVTLLKGAGVSNPTGVTYPANTEVIISDNYQFWEDIQTAINSKIDNDGTGLADGFDMQTPASGVRIRDDGGNLKFTDSFNVEIDLSTIAAASGADRKVAISPTDTTPDELNPKILAGDGLTKATNNPGGNENIEFDVDLTDSNIFTITQGNNGKALKTDGSGNIDGSFYSTEGNPGIVTKASDAEVIAGVEDTKYITSKQASDNYTLSTEVQQITPPTTTTSVLYAHSLGRTPKHIKVNAYSQDGRSMGAYSSGGTQACITQKNGNPSTGGFVFSLIESTSSDTLSGIITVVSSSDFTISYSESGTYTDDVYLVVELFA